MEKLSPHHNRAGESGSVCKRQESERLILSPNITDFGRQSSVNINKNPGNCLDYQDTILFFSVIPPSNSLPGCVKLPSQTGN